MTDLSVKWEKYYDERRDRVNWSGMLIDLMRSIRVKSRLENWRFSKTTTALDDAPNVIDRLQNKYYSERREANGDPNGH